MGRFLGGWSDSNLAGLFVSKKYRIAYIAPSIYDFLKRDYFNFVFFKMRLTRVLSVATLQRSDAHISTYL
jgi:hypothetical protein